MESISKLLAMIISDLLLKVVRKKKYSPNGGLMMILQWYNP